MKEPRSPFSGSQVLTAAAATKPSLKRNWSLQKNLPWQVVEAREKENKKKEKVLAKLLTPSKNVFLVARRVRGGFRGIRFDQIFPKFDQLKQFAREQGRRKIKMGAVITTV